jgi:hypothetical protein
MMNGIFHGLSLDGVPTLMPVPFFQFFFLNAADFSVSCLGGDVDAGALFQKKNSFISMPLTFSVPCLWADVNASALFFQFFFLFFNADDFCLSFPVSERGSCSFQ